MVKTECASSISEQVSEGRETTRTVEINMANTEIRQLVARTPYLQQADLSSVEAQGKALAYLLSEKSKSTA